MLEMPILETTHLLIRPFEMSDLADAHRLFDIELQDTAIHAVSIDSLDERLEWLQWAARNSHQLAMLDQPPYGDRAIVLKATSELIGSAGYAPCLMPFEQIDRANQDTLSTRPARFTSEVGLYYAISPAHRNLGYAHEAAQALVDYAFQHLNLKRIVATTGYDNFASIGVMKKLGMRIEKNPFSEPPWFQVIGVLENPL